ncbi:MAG: hypothetical protein WDO73_21535 [Ignavibacteriota bacterium]
MALSPNGSSSTKTLTTGNATSPGYIIQDAWAAYRVNTHLELSAGEMMVPVSRQALQSTLSYYTVNISPVATVNNGALVESALRDVGFQRAATSSTIACSIAAAFSTAPAIPTAAMLRVRPSICNTTSSIAKRNMPMPAPRSASARSWLSTSAATSRERTAPPL